MMFVVQGSRDPDGCSHDITSATTSRGGITSTSRQGKDETHPVDFQKTVIASIQDGACEKGMSEMLVGQSTGDVDVESFRIILKILVNILENDSARNVRRLRMNNPRIEKYIVHASGAMELLLGCGFDVVFETVQGGQEEGILVLPDTVDESSMATIRRVVRAIERLLGIPHHKATTVKTGAASPTTLEQQQEEEVIMSPEMRSTILELPRPVDTDVPEWFFQQSSAEIRQLYKQNKEKIENDKILMTRAMRERLAKRKEIPNSKPTIRIRVRAPEGTKIVGDFRRKEPIQALFGWISDCLVDPMLEYDVILPDRRKLGDARFACKTLEEVGLTASQTLNLCWQGESAILMKHKPAFRENI